MMTIKPLLFFGLIELALILLITVCLLLWRWLVLGGELKRIRAAWEEGAEWASFELNQLEPQRKNGGDLLGRQFECMAGILAAFRQDVAQGIKSWRLSNDMLFQAIRGFKAGTTDAPEESWGLQDLPEETWPSVRATPEDDEGLLDYPDLQTLLDAQQCHQIDLSEYDATTNQFREKLHRMTSANQKLSDYLRVLAVKDQKFLTLQRMVEKLQEGNEWLEHMLSLQEQQKKALEKQIREVHERNNSLQSTLGYYKIQMDSIFQDKSAWQEQLQAAERKIALRNKSYDRLHKKFDALRREYITLYELSAKGKIPAGREPL